MFRSFQAFLISIVLIACGGGGSSAPVEAIDSTDSSIVSNASDFSGIRLTWEPPELREDGEELEVGEILGYVIRIQSQYGNYTGPELVYLYSAQSNAYEFDITADSYEFEIAAITVHGVSDYSDVVSVILD